MKILSIETSCDETAIALIEAKGDITHPEFTILAHELYSQASKHAEYGGVYPTLAKREHAANLVPLLQNILQKTHSTEKGRTLTEEETRYVSHLLEREPNLADALLDSVEEITLSDIDAIAVTEGPGLEPALWVGINFAKALSFLWNIPIVPVNHMEGHIFSVLQKDISLEYPVLSLLISGGHTQLVLSPEPFSYIIIGETRDDAVGEAYDKVARMLNLSYPGGPIIAQKAQEARDNNIEAIPLPRPMIDSDDFDFSFSGLKTAVLYALEKYQTVDENTVRAFARGFEDAATDVLLSKVQKALEKYKPHSLIVAGGVSANTYLQKQLKELLSNIHSSCVLRFPADGLSTDNAIMIGMVGYMRHKEEYDQTLIRAQGNLSLRK